MTDDDGISARLRKRIRRDFPDAEVARGVAGALRGLAEELEYWGQDPERLMAAALFVADGKVRGLREAVLLGRVDGRDLLVAGGLAYEDWPEVMDAELGAR
ncbi:hypothetical protein [Streptomyces sp. NPDC059575]|uniref:hypothetical protein n=1 Tax=Streptomyces sp. NPDC059575 TaxID=3346872 RepID=UPI0036C8224C